MGGNEIERQPYCNKLLDVIKNPPVCTNRIRIFLGVLQNRIRGSGKVRGSYRWVSSLVIRQGMRSTRFHALVGLDCVARLQAICVSNGNTSPALRNEGENVSVEIPIIWS